MKDKDVISFLKKFSFIGQTSTNPYLEELLVPWHNAVVELNFYNKTNFTEDQLKKILAKEGVKRRTLEELFKIKKEAQKR
jgi:hypothetical protein